MSNYVYLQHPVDKAEVRKYNAQGLKVLDIRFKPVDEEPKPVKKAVKSRAKK
jgi:hypothetical protein